MFWSENVSTCAGSFGGRTCSRFVDSGGVGVPRGGNDDLCAGGGVGIGLGFGLVVGGFGLSNLGLGGVDCEMVSDQASGWFVIQPSYQQSMWSCPCHHLGRLHRQRERPKPEEQEWWSGRAC